MALILEINTALLKSLTFIFVVIMYIIIEEYICISWEQALLGKTFTQWKMVAISK